MLPYQLRVVQEKVELDEKIKRLREFKQGEVYTNLPVGEMILLSKQLSAMDKYSECLGKRIAAFK